MTCDRAVRRQISPALRCFATGLCTLSATCAAAAAGDAGWSLSFGGEVRERFESSEHPLFGLDEPPRDDYLLHRLYLSADLTYEQRFRVYVEGLDAATSGWDGAPQATQHDPADILQAFVEGSFEAYGGSAQLRAGRQELRLGSSRLVSVRESPNVRRAFDGLRASWSSSGRTRIDVFVLQPVIPESGDFDDRSSSAQKFWGLYATSELSSPAKLALDYYYLGLDRDNALFAAGRGDERRHTLGARLFGKGGAIDLNFEGAWQWGRFGAGSIRAWTLSIDAGYMLRDWPGSPRIGLKADVISGDRDPGDRSLGTFNPLFPKLPYFSEADIATPANLLDLQPSVGLTLPHRIGATLSWNALWKYARQDAWYAPPLTPVRRTSPTDSRHIGWQMSVLLEWQATEHLDVAGTYVHYEPGAFVQKVGGTSGRFAAAWINYSF